MRARGFIKAPAGMRLLKFRRIAQLEMVCFGGSCVPGKADKAADWNN
jgi:hypothetical protein